MNPSENRSNMIAKLVQHGCTEPAISAASDVVLADVLRVMEDKAKAKDTPLGVDKMAERKKVEKSAETFRQRNHGSKLADSWAKGFEAFAELNPGATAEDFLGQHLGAP